MRGRHLIGRGRVARMTVLPSPSMGQGGIGLADDIEKLIGDLPKDLAGGFQRELDTCLAYLETGDPFDILKAGTCLKTLYEDIQAALKGEKPPAPPPTQPRPTTTPEPPGIPAGVWVIGGVSVAALVAALTL